MIDPASDDRSALPRLIALAREMGADPAADEAQQLSERISQGRFYVVCVGQFKRGKSTLLNALVGSAVLPVGVTPVTSAITILAFGAERRARVRFEGGRVESIEIDEVARYVSEQQNPENRLGVVAVEIFTPSPLLAGGLCLVDTPGIGSVFAGNTAVTRAFLPQIDAALVIIGADPPLSGEELTLIQEIARETPEVAFALNKSDRLSDAERQEGHAFAVRTLAERAGLAHPTVFLVSAMEVSQGTPTREWPQLQQHLERLTRESGAGLVRAAEQRGVERLSRAILWTLDEQLNALTRPHAESEARLATLQHAVEEIDHFVRDVAPVMAAEDARLGRTFESAREAFLGAAVPRARAATVERVAHLTGPRRRLRRDAWAAAIEEADRLVHDWQPVFQPMAEQGYRELTARFVRLTNDHVHEVGRSTGLPVDVLPADLPPEGGFRTRSRLFYSEALSATTASLLDIILEWLLPPSPFRRRVTRKAQAHAEWLVVMNTSRLIHDAIERVHQSRLLLETGLRGRLRSTVGAARTALADAKQTVAHGSAAVTAEMQRLEQLRARALTITAS